MPNKKRIFVIINIILLIALVVFAVVWFIGRDQEKPLQTEVSFTAEADKSILEQTDEQTDAVIVDSGQGAYVESIGGLKNGDQNGGFWVYYVNGQQTDTVPDDYIPKNGDLIEWKFE